MTKKLAKILTFGVLIIMALGLFTACTDYGYEFHFDVVGGNGELTLDSNIAGIMQCKDEPAHELECADTSKFVVLLGGKKGSHELIFIAIPDEGYQVKEWLFNGKIIEGNKTNSYKAKVSSEQNYSGVISVRFEAIQS